MCGRYTLTTSGEELGEFFDLPSSSHFKARYNIAPSQNVAVVRASPGGTREPAFLRWGLVPAWVEDLKKNPGWINARSETVATRAAFRNSFEHRRCLVPANGFYEWKKQGGHKQPFYLRRHDRRLLAMAGIWARWSGPGAPPFESYAVLTTEPNSLVATLHDRMPVFLEPTAFERWLDPAPISDAERRELLCPYPAEEMEAFPVSTRVNQPRHDDAELIVPVEPPAVPRQLELF